mgnify:CR=1 FL=1
MDLLAEGHPVDRCRHGAEKLQEALDELWPDDADEPEAGLADLSVCPNSQFTVRWPPLQATVAG